jgi:hypothetical protein
MTATLEAILVKEKLGRRTIPLLQRNKALTIAV